MKELALTEIENEQIKKLFNTFFEVIQHSLEIKDKNRNLPFYKRKPDKDLRSLVENKEVLQSKHFDLFIKNIQALEKNEAYLDTTDWKVLAFLSPGLMDSKNPIAVYEALDYLNQFEFLGENNFSVIKLASVIYSLSQSDPLNTAKMLVRLDHFDLLTEQNLGKICANSQLNSQLFSSVLNKLSLNGGINHLLTQANLDKLLENPRLNLDILAKFMQAENKSELLTQEKFDLAINLKNLLTLENIDKIEKAEFDPKMLAEVISLLDKANILTQDNFDQLIGLNKVDFEKIVPVLDKMYEKQILNQDNVLKLLDTFLATRIYDERVDGVDSINGQQSSKASLTDKFCMMLKKLLYNAQVIFDKIIAGFNKITKRYETPDISEPDAQRVTENHNSFFNQPKDVIDNAALKVVNISNTLGVK
jgi:hypothetical protein